MISRKRGEGENLEIKIREVLELILRRKRIEMLRRIKKELKSEEWKEVNRMEGREELIIKIEKEMKMKIVIGEEWKGKDKDLMIRMVDREMIRIGGVRELWWKRKENRKKKREKRRDKEGREIIEDVFNS